MQHRSHRRYRFNPWGRKILWSRAWQPIPVFLPGESHGHRSLVGYIQETVIKTIPIEKKCKKAKWLSMEALQIAVKRREVKIQPPPISAKKKKT